MAQLPYSIQSSKGPDANVVEISGNLVINHIDKIYAEMNDKIDLTKNLNLNIVNVDSIDITFVQLFLALKKEFSQLGLTLKVKIEMSDETRTLLNNAGFHKQLIN